MANNRVPSYVGMDQQINTQEVVEICLGKLKALITVALTTKDFYDLSDNILHNYFSIAGDLVEEAEKAHLEDVLE